MNNNTKKSNLNILKIYLNLNDKNKKVYQNKQLKFVILGEIVYETKQRNYKFNNSLVLSVSNIYGCIPQKERFKNRIIASDNLSNYKILSKFDFAYNPAAINIGSIGMNKNFNTGIVSPMYITFSLKKNLVLPNYLELFFKSNNFKNEVKSKLEGSVRMLLTYKSFSKIKIKLPHLQIQKSLFEFFNIIYKTIDKETSIMNFWNLMISKIDQKTLEFGKDLKKYYLLNSELKTFFYSFSGLQGLKAENFLQKGNKYLPYKKIYGNKICDEKDLLDFKITDKKQNIIKENDILVTTSSETQDEVGICSLYVSNVEAYLNSFCFGVRLKENYKDQIYPKYVNVALSFKNHRKEIFKLSSGSTRYNLSKTMFFALNIKLPNYQTQVKIADLFYKLYDLVNLQKKIIDLLKRVEKYFINSLIG